MQFLEVGLGFSKLTKNCQIYLDFEYLQLDQAYFYQSLPLCAIDAVYSIGVLIARLKRLCGVFPSPEGRGPRVRGY
ncbi:MAG: hypothetical protein PWQ55_2423 [Chloroflexota bacterium]|nr:hypothetical protein [Chloroflexota bacterium]